MALSPEAVALYRYIKAGVDEGDCHARRREVDVAFRAALGLPPPAANDVPTFSAQAVPRHLRTARAQAWRAAYARYLALEKALAEDAK